ncbi:methionine synthase [Allokutzneria albata]|uniref:Cobalamin-independent synthase, Catalytic domain n=2 Tax=Allokutzneria albata TaxID=211114 RepID=A0A1G9XLQ4_ALLAB|nr:methionine synthase [Allokutzneria albata]SDM97183.1 Cobalamin-independent synthase, Catalytic domain [Allokutzneria albata]
MTQSLLPAGTATGIGSMPGVDPLEAARVVAGELPVLPHLPELPARGVGADLIGRTAGLLVDLAVEVVPSGYRVTARPGRDHRRCVDQLRGDMDAMEEVLDGVRPELFKVQAAGPWTLTSMIELQRGHRVLTDHGALREFGESLAEGLARHVAEVAARTGAKVIVQLDEPMLPAVLAGSLPTPSGYGTVAQVHAPEAEALLRNVITSLDVPVVVHCCANRPPVTSLRRAGASAIALDLAPLSGKELLDELGEAWQEGVPLWLGVVPGVDPGKPVSLREAAQPAFALADQLGFDRAHLAKLAVPTPACGLAGATPQWARRALSLVNDVAKAFVEPPESW